MHQGVIHQVQQHLFNEHGVHGQQQRFLRYGDGDVDFLVALAEVHHRFAEHFLQNLPFFLNLPHFPAADAGDGEEVFHHAVKPVRVLLGVQQQFVFLLLAQRAAVLQHGGDGAADGGEGCAQVMGDGPQQVGPHLLPLRLGPQLLLRLDPCGQGADGKAHRQHGHEGEGIAVDGEIQLQIGVGKSIVHPQHTEQRRQQAVEIALGGEGHHQHRQHKNHGHMGVRGGEPLQKGAEGRGGGHGRHEDQPGPGRQREVFFYDTFQPVHHLQLLPFFMRIIP